MPANVCRRPPEKLEAPLVTCDFNKETSSLVCMRDQKICSDMESLQSAFDRAYASRDYLQSNDEKAQGWRQVTRKQGNEDAMFITSTDSQNAVLGSLAAPTLRSNQTYMAVMVCDYCKR